jgi:glycosyltransferase involved in cell wall biosynthesis
VGGVVAYNEERRIATALRSLLDQDLPPGFVWNQVWVVASGCTDRTAEIARSLDSRVRVLEEPERRGKANALLEVFSHAKGDYLVLLNGDARAVPGALRALVDEAGQLRPPYAIMGHPIPEPLGDGWSADAVSLLWELDHQFHRLSIAQGTCTNLSDELLLLPTSHLPPIPPETINDGGFIGAWLTCVGGQLRYATSALVEIEVPTRFGDYVTQRRRIRFGLDQVARQTGVIPSTLQQLARTDPRRALDLLRSIVRKVPRGVRGLTWLIAAEVAAIILLIKDRIRPFPDPVRWRTIPDYTPTLRHR